MDKILTIIIPTYNMEKYLRKCLDSLIVRDELMEKVEVLIINDGSKDSSSQIAHEYEKKWNQTFRVIDKENGNYGSCVNRGLAEAKGKYVKILDSDDYFSNEFDKYLTELCDINADIVITDFDLINSADEIEDSVTCNLDPRKYLSFNDIYKSDYLLNIEMHSITYLRENLIKVNYKQTEGISYTDQEWSFMPMIGINNLYYIPVSLYRYYIGRPGQTVEVSTFYKNIRQNFDVLRNTVEFYFRNRTNAESNKSEYLYRRLCNRIDILYKRYLIDKSSLKDEIKDFYIFEVYLKERYLQLYKDSLDYCIFDKKIPYHYLKEWNRNENSCVLKFMTQMYSILLRLRKIKACL